MRVPAQISIAALVTAAAFSQTASQPAFEAADIHPSSKGGRLAAQGPFTGGGRYTLRTATVLDLMMKAYGIDDENKIIGGPNWLSFQRFDILASMANGTTPEDAKLMLQSLLANRFKLVAKKEDRPMPAYNLVAGKGKPKLREAAGSSDNGCKAQIQGLPPANAGGEQSTINISALTVNYTCRNMTMEAFAQLVRNYANDVVGAAPIYDKTDLKGAWDFEFKMSLNLGRALGAANPDAISFPDALDKQLGLRLDAITVPQQVMVVESITEPTPNAPDVAKLLPPAPTEFDVADIRPSAPPQQGGGPIRMGIQFQPGGRFNMTGLPLRTLILQAWGINVDMLAGAPKFTETDRYDIIAKAPADSVPVGQRPNAEAAAVVGVPMDQETVYVMVRNLLTDRFKIKYHYEDRPAAAYDLVAAKPKIKKADPNSRTKWFDGVPPGVKDPRNGNSALGRVVTVQNMTMAQFGNELQYIGAGYVRSPVLDKTGLEGAYDFTLAFSAPGVVNNGGRGPTLFIGNANGTTTSVSLNGGNGDANATDPNGAISLFDAMEKQLGLKLVETKRPVQVMVIDHIEEKPVEN